MPYVAPTFTNGTTLTAGSHLNAGLDFLDFAIALDPDAFVGEMGPAQILRPRIQVVSENLISVYTQTGSIHRLRLPAMNYIGQQPMTDIPFTPSGFISDTYHQRMYDGQKYNPLPGTWISYYADRATVKTIIRWSGEVIVPNDFTVPATSQNVIFAGHSGEAVKLSSVCRIPEQTGSAYSDERRIVQSCALFSAAPSIGWNSVGLLCGMSANFGLIAGFEIVVEVFYL